MSAADDRYNHSEKGRERWRSYAKRKYYERKYDDLCVKCGKDWAIAGLLCGDCQWDKQDRDRFRM